MLRPGHSANFWKGLSSKHLATFCRDIGGICKGVQLVLHIQQLLLQITESDGIPGHEVKGMILNLISWIAIGVTYSLQCQVLLWHLACQVNLTSLNVAGDSAPFTACCMEARRTVAWRVRRSGRPKGSSYPWQYPTIQDEYLTIKETNHDDAKKPGQLQQAPWNPKQCHWAWIIRYADPNEKNSAEAIQ